MTAERRAVKKVARLADNWAAHLAGKMVGLMAANLARNWVEQRGARRVACSAELTGQQMVANLAGKWAGPTAVP